MTRMAEGGISEASVPATVTIPDDAEANKLLTREYRKPYVMPDEV